jgi:hypothetical protein
MVLKNGDQRRKKIDELLKNGKKKSWIDKRRSVFIDALDNTWIGLREKAVEPSDYLRGGRRELDREHYEDHFAKKIIADYRLAQDGDFRSRYIKGYEFPAVPRFRQDAPSWDGFVRSWCESIALEIGKPSRRSLLAKKLIALLEPSELDTEMGPDEISDWLRTSWENQIWDGDEKTNLGECLMAYYLE